MLILIAEDDAGLRHGLTEFLQARHEVITCEDGLKAAQLIKERVFDVIISDYKMPGLTGLELLKRAREQAPFPAFLLITAYGSTKDAVEAIRLGAEDYLTKPFHLSEIQMRIKRIEDLRTWQAEKALKMETGIGVDRLIGKSAAIEDLKRFVLQVCGVDSPVLLLGPTGSGKEVVARAIHESGDRVTRPFIAINCASLSEQLMESELFGHEKGAFTGAHSAKQGKFELAKGGSLFLDELGELSHSLQAKLLRVMQEKEFYRLGGTRLLRADTRVLAATHRPLKEMVKAGTFREDLYFRFNVIGVEVPPLSSRKEDVPLLMETFLERLNRKFGRQAKLAPETDAILRTYAYPGNVRELQNLLERLVVLCPPDNVVPPTALPKEVFPTSGPEAVEKAVLTGGLTETVEAFEWRLIMAALEESGHNQAQAAKLLQLDRSALRYKLKKYGYKNPEEGDPEMAA